jgi:hypothetical protein
MISIIIYKVKYIVWNGKSKIKILLMHLSQYHKLSRLLNLDHKIIAVR